METNETIDKWKKGIDKITPLQQLKVQLYSTVIMLIGIIAGIVVMLFYLDKYWWVLIVLLGALLNTSVQFLGLLQKYRLLNKLKGGFTLKNEQESTA